MRILAAVIVSLSFVGCSSEPRFVHTGGSVSPYVMFDNKTAQACYAGSFEALKDRMEAIRRQADMDATLDNPSALVAYYFPQNKGGGFVPSVFVELNRQSLEYSKKAAEEYREVEKLAEVKELPTCRSLL